MPYGNDSFPSTNGRHRTIQPRIHVRHLDVLSRVSSDLIQSSPFLKPNFLQPLLDVEAEINPWGVFKASRGVLCALLAIGAYASNSVDDVEGYRALKPPWCWDTDRLRLSCSDANDACEMLIRKNEFGLLKDLINWVVAAQTAV